VIDEEVAATAVLAPHCCGIKMEQTSIFEVTFRVIFVSHFGLSLAGDM
jgi:hypothetical protein